MAVITLPWSMEQDRINQIKANSTHVDDNFNTLLNALNGKLEADGSILPTADQSWNGHKITNLAAPTVSADAATKGYVDEKSNAVRNTLATKQSTGMVQAGENINVDDNGVISVALGSSTTIAQAAEIKIRQTSISNSVPLTGADGVLYFTYEE